MDKIDFIKEGIFADFHIHSRFSRACSININFENLVKWARIKGLNVLGTGDFTHPVWFDEIKKLEDREKGFYYYDDFPFVITGEVSLIYTQEKGRRIHLNLLVPSIEIAKKINDYLDTKGRRDYDGRPIFKISCEDFVREMMNISKEIEVIPAHCLPGDTLIHSNHSLKKIKNIEEGDFVYTHNNNWKKVVKVFSRKYSGKLYKIRPWYWTEGLESTPEHPFYTIKSYKCSWIKGLCKKGCSKLNECKNKRFEKYLREWVPASELSEGDFLVYPRFNKIINQKSIKKIKITPDFCRLLGYYLAEGYTIRNEGIGFSFNKNEEEYIQEVINLINKIFGKNKFKFDERKGKDIIFYSKEINEFFSQFYSSDIRKANTKILLDFMLDLPLKKQIEIFRGWYRGDKGYTVSRELMNQMKIICLRLGIVPNIHRDLISDHKKRGNHFIGDREIKANYDLYSLGNLSFFEDKFNLLNEREFKKFKTKMSRRHGWVDKDYVYLPIRKIEVFNYNDYVYNLEVEEDNSYVSEFACIHNCWTPWFGVFGSMSGFDSLREAFGNQFEMIHAIETGISSDPKMNWKIKELENKSIVSFSDAHSFWPFRLGREATIFRKVDSYSGIANQIRNNDFLGTIETDPAYGKYHWDGHRNCDFSCSPEKTKELNGICPVCKNSLVIGVENRVEQLSSEGSNHKQKKEYFTLLPLHEVISLAVGNGMQSGKVWEIYNFLIKNFQNEFNILLNVSKEEFLTKSVDGKLIELILKNRQGKINVKPGFDGEYGIAQVEEKQRKLF